MLVEEHDLQPLLGDFQRHAVGVEAEQEGFIDGFQELQPLVGPRQLAVGERVGRVVHQEEVLARLDLHVIAADQLAAFPFLPSRSRPVDIHALAELLTSGGPRVLRIDFQRLGDRVIELRQQAVPQGPLGRGHALVGVVAGLAELPAELAASAAGPF